jgi:site-specific recombinase XerD
MNTLKIIPRGTPSELELLVSDYLLSCRSRGLSPRTLDNYGPALERVFLTWCSEEQITGVGQLDRRALDRFTAHLLNATGRYGAQLSKHTVHAYVRPVRQFLTWAATEGEAVTAKPQLPKLPKLYKDALSREQIDKMEAATPAERDKLIVRLFGDCGLRLSELMALERTSILRSGRQTMLAVLGKGNRERRVPVPPNLIRRLDRYISGLPNDRQSERIFLSLRRGRFGDYEPLTDSGVKQVVRDAALRAGIGRTVHPHLLRHSWMTEMLRRGIGPSQLRVVAGASPEVIARHYDHVTEDDAYESVIRALTGGSQPR